MMLSIFSCICWPSVCLLWRNIYLSLLPRFCFFFHFFLLICMSCLYIFINPLLLALFASIFSHSEVCVFILSFEGMGVKKIAPG